MIRLGGVTVIVSRGGGVDRWGDPLPSVQIPIPGCVLAPRTSTEDTLNFNDTVITGQTIYAPPEATFLATDTVKLPGETGTAQWAVVGDPGVWTNPFSGQKVGVQVAIQRTTG